MKTRIILVSIIVIALVSAMIAFLYIPKKTEKIEIKDDFLTIPTYTTETTSSTSSYGKSYWFVVGMDNTGVMRNAFIEQDHTYFSYSEAKVTLTHECFITNIVKVDKETYERNK